jgi:futalosine hydrolase
LTVCATSANQAEMQERRQRFPQAVAEDMEGFAVALACRMAGVPLTIIRGISNRVGVRDIQTWRIDEPLGAAGALLCEILGLPQTTP